MTKHGMQPTRYRRCCPLWKWMSCVHNAIRVCVTFLRGADDAKDGWEQVEGTRERQRNKKRAQEGGSVSAGQDRMAQQMPQHCRCGQASHACSSQDNPACRTRSHQEQVWAKSEKPPGLGTG